MDLTSVYRHIPRPLKERIKRALHLDEIPVTRGEFDLNSLPRLLGRDDPVILDVGCNDGTHTLKFLELFPRAQVYAFEPDPRAQESFRRKVTDARARLFECAVSDRDGTAVFYQSDGLPSPEWESYRPGGWDLSGSIRRPKNHLEEHPWCRFDRKMRVRTVRLDTWRAEQGVERIDFLWADVQGAGENLIRGGTRALKGCRFIHIEYNDAELYEGQITLRETRRLLPGFEVLYRFENDVLLKNARRRVHRPDAP